MKVFKSKASLQTYLKTLKGKKLALVPTMGCLHEGHLSLVRLAKEKADICITTIFVNPKQFNQKTDLDIYPREELEDCKKLEKTGNDIVYIPNALEMYQENFATSISLPKLSNCLCGSTRPGHMDGVALVITKLFNQIRPDIAIFGQKDYQQLLIIDQLNKDLDFGIEIIGAPTYREQDGLAMSSRNKNLTKQERLKATILFESLNILKNHIKHNNNYSKKIDELKKDIVDAGFSQIHYFEVRSSNDLELINSGKKLPDQARIFIASSIGNCRLIDNIVI